MNPCDIPPTIEHIRTNGPLNLRTETGTVTIEAPDAEVVTEFTIHIKHDGELHRSFTVSGLALGKFLHDTECRIDATEPYRV